MDINTRVVTLVETGHCCVVAQNTSILAVRCLEIILKLIESTPDGIISMLVLQKVANLVDSVINVDIDDFIGLICSNMNSFPTMASTLVRLIFLTADWTKESALLLFLLFEFYPKIFRFYLL